MSSWGSVNFKDLKAFQKRLKNLEKTGADKFCEDTIRELANRMLAKVIKRTPAVSGELRRNWRIGEITKRGNLYEIEVINSTEYAPYVEFGHRQEVGQFVPELGKRLKKPWIEGRFMMTISEQELDKDKEKIIEKRLMQFLGGVIDGK